MNKPVNKLLSGFCVNHFRWIISGLVVLLAMAVVSLGLLYTENQQLLSEGAAKLTSVKTENVANSFSSLLTPVIKDLKVLAAHLSSGFLAMDDPATSSKIIDPILATSTNVVCGLMIADSNGNEFKLIASYPGQFEIVKSDYDPRTRPWFGGALAADQNTVFWSGPYQFYTTGQNGVTASIAVDGQDGSKLVVAIDLSLENFRRSIAQLSLPPDSYLFIQNHRQISDISYLIDDTPLSEITGTETKPSSIITLAAFHRQENKIAPATPFSFKDGDNTWWSQAIPLAPGYSESEISLVMAQEQLVQAPRHQLLAVLFFIGITIVAILLVALLRYQGQVLKEAVSCKGCLDLDQQQLLDVIRQGESDSLEFKSTLRINLHTQKPDKAMEISCLKTIAAFLNSQGGTLIVGVKDDGQILGLANDRFENQDKFLLHFNNLVKRHLAMDSVNYFSFGIKEVAEQEVFIVDCRRSEVPVFIRDNQQEDLYVRVGPGSRALTVGESIEYIKNHF